MKKKVLMILLMISVVLNAQQKDYNIVWETSQTHAGENFSIEIPSFNKEYATYNDDQGLQFVDQWETQSGINESSVTITNVNYQAISKSELEDLDISKIPNTLEFSLKNSISRNKRYAFFQCSPIIKDTNGNFKKLISFSVNYSFGANSNRRVATNRKFTTSKVISNSVLNSGEWYRFYVDTTGVFKISKDFLQQLGVNVNSVDPRNIKLFGHGGKMAPYSNMVSYPYDVPENAIKFVGEEDGVLNNEDYILFYAQGPKGYDAEKRTHINCYNDKTFYYINISPGNGKRLQPMSQPSGAPSLIIDTFEDYKFHEKDVYNLLSLGRRWFGDKFDVDSKKVFEFDFPDLVTSEPVKVGVVVASTSSTNSSMNISLNGQSVTTLNLPGVSKPTYGSGASYIGSVNVSSAKVSVELNYDNQGNPSAEAYIDYVFVEALRALKFSDEQFQFKNSTVISETGIGEYQISNAIGLSEIWDVTDIYNVTSLANEEGSSSLNFKSTLGSLKTYMAISSSDYYIPK